MGITGATREGSAFSISRRGRNTGGGTTARRGSRTASSATRAGSDRRASLRALRLPAPRDRAAPRPARLRPHRLGGWGRIERGRAIRRQRRNQGSATGRRRPAGHRRHRTPALRHVAVGGPGRIERGTHRARPSSPRHGRRRRARRAPVPPSANATRRVGAAMKGASASRARAHIRRRRWPRAPSTARSRYGRAPSLQASPPPLKPTQRGIAGPHMGVGLGEIGMRPGAPRRLQHLHGAPGSGWPR